MPSTYAFATPAIQPLPWAPSDVLAPTQSPAPIASDCAALVINYNTARQTVRNIESLLAGTRLPAHIHLLDNASAPDDLAWLQAHLPAPPSGVQLHLYRADTNLGFAAGSNALIDRALAQPATQYTLLLNNDAVAQPPLLQQLRQALVDGAAHNIHMAGARMHRLAQPGVVDTLGIAIYASLMPADRHSLDDPYAGPTGGCAIYSRALLDALHQTSGYWFDPRYFCYWEDTDLVLRARLLGFDAAHIDQTLALHEGQASSSGGSNDFIAYHGWRNGLWMHLKLIPAGLLIRYGPLLLLAHAANVMRCLLTGQARLLWRIYRDAWGQRQAFISERQQWTRHPQAATRLRPLIAPRFYRKGYLRQLFGKAGP